MFNISFYMRLQQSSRFAKPLQQFLAKSDLRTVLVVPFVLQIAGTVGLVGYLSFRNGQQAVNDLANQLLGQVGNRVEQHLDQFLATPTEINQTNLDAIELGVLELDNFEQLGQLFWKQMQIFDVGYINYANQAGEFIGVERLETDQFLINETRKPSLNTMTIYQTDREGHRVGVKVIDAPDPVQSEGWYAAAASAGRPVWSQIYQWNDKPEVLSISSSYPVYGRNQVLIGVIGVDLLLSGISEFLRTLRVSPSARIFVIERDGSLVATSSKQPAYQVANGEAKRLSALDSSDPLIQGVAQHLHQKFGQFAAIHQSQQLEFQVNQERQFIQVTPWRDSLGLDWLVVIAVPEGDFMTQIEQNTRLTIALVGGCLCPIGCHWYVYRPLGHGSNSAT